ncbi:MAG: holin [Clostridia bacterium]|nr:holin [Clostridia bacterium]
MKNRLTSPVVWLSILSQILLVITLINPAVADTVKIVGTVIIEILTLVGILNNPTDKQNF